MARPIKQGLDYFPIDVDLDQDDKLGMIIGEFGEKGERLWIKLLSWIYKNDGYFCEWNEDVQLRFLRRYSYCGFSMSFIQEVVPRFIKWGLLDQVVFNTFHMLTSERVQKTWLDATRKRKDRQIDQNIWLLEVNDGLKAEETGLKAEVIHKVKEIKVKESKEELFLPETESVPASQNNSLKDRQEKMLIRQKEFYIQLASYLNQYGKDMLRAFYNHWSEPNKSRTKMLWEMQKTWDLNLRLIKWESNDAKFNKGKTVNNGQSESTEEYRKKREELEERTRKLSSQ